MKKYVWIDTDLSVGMKRTSREGYCDVDDGFAVLQLMKSAQIDIVGISAVFGNTDIENSFRLCEMMNSRFAGGKYRVYKGAGEPIALTDVKTNDAVEGLAAALRVRKLTVMAIGPATNIGLLLLKYPELGSQIEEVVLVAGRRKPTDYFAIGNKGNRAKDLNFDLDNDAFKVLLERRVPVTLCPFELSNLVWIGGQDLDMLAGSDAACSWLATHSEPWLQQWVDQGADGFNPFDVLASHYLISPEDIIFENLNARLEIHPDDTVYSNDNQYFKNYLICDKQPGFPVKYCYQIVQGYHDKLIRTFLGH